MLRKERRSGILRHLLTLLAIWLPLAGMQTALAVEPADREEVAALYAAQSLRVSVWLNKDTDEVYRRGELLQASFQTNEDAYAVLYHIDVDGRVDILWPTARYSDGFVFGGHLYRLPANDGRPLRAGQQEGLGYVVAVVSRYPFDLRDLPLDFHHDAAGGDYDVHVAGDPYLAMNEVNYTVTGLEDSSDYVITNHASYYVHRQVDHPRYLCSQCHDDDTAQRPYHGTCTITIRHDYGWQNEWWAAYNFFPVYYYPTYFYVDPWSGYRWVNYWYAPWYRWPAVGIYTWPYACYDWRYSPYWTWDSRVAYERGFRRYAPLSRPTADGDRARDRVAARTKNRLVTDARPGEDRLRAMTERRVSDRTGSRVDPARDRRGDPAGGVARDVQRATRPQERYQVERATGAAPGLRLPAPEDDAGADPGRTRTIRPAPAAPDRDGRPEIRRDGRDDAGQRQIRPSSDPRRGSGRVWTNRRSGGQTEPRPQVPAVRPPAREDDRRQAPATEVRPDAGRGREGREAGVRRPSSPPPKAPSTPPPSPPPARRQSGSSVKQRPASPPPQAPASPPANPRRGDGRKRGDQQISQAAPEVRDAAPARETAAAARQTGSRSAQAPARAGGRR